MHFLYQIEVRVFVTCLTDMEKHKTLEILLKADFQAFLEYCIFRDF